MRFAIVVEAITERGIDEEENRIERESVLRIERGRGGKECSLSIDFHANY